MTAQISIQSSQTLCSGDDTLDALVGTGLPRNLVTVVCGPPGSGKTVFCEQFLFANATPERPGVYFSTLAEPTDKLLRFAQSFDFFDAEAIGSAILYEDLYPALDRGDIDGAIAQITDCVARQNPSLIVVDSLDASLDQWSRGAIGRLLARISAVSSQVELSSFWIAESSTDELASAALIGLADAVVRLSSPATDPDGLSTIEIVKLRGHSHVSGRHPMSIDHRGLRVAAAPG
ncbi:MAG: ATPase domain-containing protein [Actinomycetota bacterium]|nr:ATPase domain-containing protein [Actinomycetota bacterium]